MNEAPKRMWVHEGFWRSGDAAYWTDDENTYDGDIPYIRADIVDELVEALEFAWPIIERERYKLEGSYGKNFDSAKADRARQACEKTKAALAKLEESHD